MTTSPVMTVTDELLAELEEITSRQPGANLTVRSSSMNLIYSELRRLRAENAGLSQSLEESRANDQAAMGWLTSLRWASGDRGERMLPELVTHIEGLAKDAGRYLWLRIASAGNESAEPHGLCVELWDTGSGHEISGADLDTAIDTAMATQ